MGGDQTLFGGGTRPLFLADDLRALRLLRVARASALWGRSRLINRSARYVFVENAWQPLLNFRRGVRVTERQSRHRYCPWLAPSFVREMNLAERRAASSRPRCRTVFDQYALEDLQVVSYSMDQHWNQVVGTFEMRFPLLYRPLVEFMLGLPTDQKMRAGEDRVLQRRALAGLLPEPVRTRQDKRGPDQAFFAGLLKNPRVFDLLLDRPALVERGYVDGKAWTDVVRAARFACVPRFSTFFATVTLELWLKQDQWRALTALG
jgi:asparagine synthase (glutamine-hydrolysing)